MRVSFRKSVNALTPVFSAIVVILVVTSTVGSVVFWGVPYVNTLESKKERENIEMQFSAIADAIDDIVNSNPGDGAMTPIIPGDGGSIYINQEKDRVILMYSYHESYDFNIYELGLDDDPAYFEIDLPDGLSNDLCSKAVISWTEFDETCFLAGTKILMADGSYKNIEDVEVGDIIKSYDEQTRKFMSCRVSNVFHHTPLEMPDYYLVINDQLCVTPNHRFYSDDKWVFAGDIEVGDPLFCRDYDEVYRVYSLERVYERVSTFDLKVEGCHTYFVSIEDGVEVLVHNHGLNSPPNPPDFPDPPDGATDVDINPTLRVYVYDPDGDTMVVTFWGSDGMTVPGIIDQKEGASGNYVETVWSGRNYDTTYSWYAAAFDGEYEIPSAQWTFTTESANSPPGTPSVPSGPESLEVFDSGMYITSAVDPEGDMVQYRFDWDADGSHDYSDWTDLVGSGESAGLTHSWGSAGSYVVKAQARDEHYAMSGWSNGLTVVVSEPIINNPPNKPTNNYPPDGSTGVEINPELNVTVSDPDGGFLTVKFFNASDDFEPLYTATGVPSSGWATYTWSGLGYDKTYSWYANASDGGFSNQSLTWEFTTAANQQPNQIDNLYPPDTQEGIETNPELKVQVYDPNGDTMTVSFYDASDDTHIGTVENVPSGGTASVTWNGLNYLTWYSWYVVANDSVYEATSSGWSFKTKAEPPLPPYKPTNPSPSNGAIDIGLNPTLSVDVYDPNGDTMTVKFYNASDNSLIGTGVLSGDTASITWPGLGYGKTYIWYANASDGSFYNCSITWSFTTMPGSCEIFNRNDNDPWAINTQKSLEGTVIIKLYNADSSIYGKIFIFDSNSITNGEIVLENGGLVYSSSEDSYVKNGPRIYEKDGVFSFSVVQMVKSSSSSIGAVGGSGTYKLNTKFKGSAMQRDEAKGDEVYGLKLQFHGDHKDAWSTYLNRMYNFMIQVVDGKPDTLVYQNDGVHLMLWHSFITFSIEK